MGCFNLKRCRLRSVVWWGRVYEIVSFRQLLLVNPPLQYLELYDIRPLHILPDRTQMRSKILPVQLTPRHALVSLQLHQPQTI